MGEGRAWDRGQHLQDVKTSASKICKVPWTNLPQAGRLLDGSAVRCAGSHSPRCPCARCSGSGLQGTRRGEPWASLPSPTPSLPPPPAAPRAQCMWAVTQKGSSQHLFLRISIISPPCCGKALVPRQRVFTLARTKLPTEEGRFAFAQQRPRSATVPDGEQPGQGFPDTAGLCLRALGVQLHPQGNEPWRAWSA